MLDYKTLDEAAIIKWCQDNNQLEWLAAKLNETVVGEFYSKKVMVWDDEKGKYIYLADKTSTIVKKEIPITFIQVKRDFAEKFMPDILPKGKGKKETMRDRVAALLAQK